MTIDPCEKWCGFPIVKIRDFFRRQQYSWRLDDLRRFLNTSEKSAAGLIEELFKRGYIESYDSDRDPSHVGFTLATMATFPLPRKVDPDLWDKTTLGCKFTAAHAARPISRKTADRVVSELIARAHTVNNEGAFAFFVTRLTAIGSYLTDVETLGDVDVVVELRQRFADHTLQKNIVNERISVAQQSGRRFPMDGDEQHWPLREVKLFLKHRSRSLQLLFEFLPFMEKCARRFIFEATNPHNPNPRSSPLTFDGLVVAWGKSE